MLNRKISFAGLFVAFSCVASVHSGVFAWLGDSIKTAYGVTGASFNQSCKSEGIGDACVGNSAMKNGQCVGWADNMSNRGTYSDEGATLLFIAQKVTTKGAKFCLTQVQGANKDKNKGVDGPWLVYFAAANNQQHCFWLCKSGYGGPECSESASGKVCDSTEISRNAFSKYKISTSSTSNLESTDWMFGRWRHACNAHGWDEHEGFLAISGWLPSKHGAKVAPMMAWADRSGWSDMDSTAIIWTVAESTVMCAPGYKPNPAGTDCETIDATACQVQNGTFCEGFSRDKFNADIHRLDTSNPKGCLRYFCSDSNKAFPSTNSVSCEDCAHGVKGGPHKDNGVCVKCETGQYFDDVTSTCKTATGLSKTDLQYGKGKSKSADVKSECWVKTAPSEYKACVLWDKQSAVDSAKNSDGTFIGKKLLKDLKMVLPTQMLKKEALAPVSYK